MREYMCIDKMSCNEIQVYSELASHDRDSLVLDHERNEKPTLYSDKSFT